MRQNQANFQCAAPVATMIRTGAENAAIEAARQGLLAIGVGTSAGKSLSVAFD